MKTLISLALLFAIPTAEAQVFKCPNGSGGTVYQSIPCPTGSPVEIFDRGPTERDRARAQRRNAEDRQTLNGQYEQRRHDAEHDAVGRGVKARKSARHDANCAKYLADAKKADQWEKVFHNKGLREIERDKAKTLRDKHFSECFVK